MHAWILYSQRQCVKLLNHKKNHYDYVKSLNDYLRVQLSAMDNVVINSPEDASPFILNISCPHYKPEVIVHDLETKRNLYFY